MVDKASDLQEKLKSVSGIDRADTLNQLASILFNSEPDKTEKYAREALSIAMKLGLENEIARSYNLIGISYHRRGNYDKAMEFYFKALEIFEKNNDQNKTAASSNNIGAMYEKQGDYDLALKFHFAALNAWKEMNDKEHLAVSYNNIGIIYEKQGKFDEALECHKKALEINQEIGDKRTVAVSYKNIGNIYGEREDYEKAIEHFLHSLKLFEEISDKYGHITCCTSLGITYTRLGKYDKAHKYFKKAINESHKYKITGLETNALRSLAILYEAQEDYKQALQYEQKYIKLENQIFSEQKAKQIAEMQTKYEADKKEKEAEIYRLKNVELAEANQLIQMNNKKLAFREKQLKLINQIIRHDIINDLAVIDSAIHLFFNSQDTSLLKEALLRIDKSVKLIYKMKEHENLLSLDNLAFFDVSEVINKVIKNYPQIKFTITGKGEILADNSIESVIDNIISNAVIHGETNEIDIKIDTIEGFCVLEIIDYGIGIPDEIKQQIFDEGFAYGKKAHTGLGLHIVKEAVTRWGGTITVQDNKPKGVVFTLRFQCTK